MIAKEKKICQFKSKYFPYKCPEPALENSRKGYCIFHEPRKDKDVNSFILGIRQKLSQEDYNFTGYWFPAIFSLLAGFVFKGEVYFSESTFEEPAIFGRSTFEKGVYFFETTFKKGASFNDSTFKERAYFAKSIFEKQSHFFGSTFEKQAFFDESSFKEATGLISCTFKDIVTVHGVRIKDPHNADVLFRKAKIAWHRDGNYVEEGKAHYQEMDYIRKQQNWFMRYFLVNVFQRLLHGYGERPGNVLISAGVFIAICAFLFMGFGIGETRLIGSGLPTYNIANIPFIWSGLSWKDVANIGRYFYFSVVTFTTLGYGDFHPTHPVSHVISCIEAFAGMFMMALFVLTFGRKWRR